jgi:hypothetical protein
MSPPNGALTLLLADRRWPRATRNDFYKARVSFVIVDLPLYYRS